MFFPRTIFCIFLGTSEEHEITSLTGVNYCSIGKCMKKPLLPPRGVGLLYMEPRQRRERAGRLSNRGMVHEQRSLQKKTKYQDRLGSILLLKAKLTNPDTRRQGRQLIHSSPANGLLLSASRSRGPKSAPDRVDQGESSLACVCTFSGPVILHGLWLRWLISPMTFSG